MHDHAVSSRFDERWSVEGVQITGVSFQFLSDTHHVRRVAKGPCMKKVSILALMIRKN